MTGTCRPLKSVSSYGGSWPHLTHDFLDPHEWAPKRHLDRFSHFCTVYPCVQHTGHATCDISSNMTHRYTACRRCGLIITIVLLRVSDVGSSSNGRAVWGRHLLADDGVTLATANNTVTTVKTGSPTLWFVQLVVGNHVVFCLCIIVLLIYVAAVVSRIVLHAFWGPVRMRSTRLAWNQAGDPNREGISSRKILEFQGELWP